MKYQIKNLKKATERIKKAIKDKERIILYGDTDLDGTTSVIILQEAIKSLSGEVTAVYFPQREKEGYGLTKKSLTSLKKEAPALLITLDCGISSVEEVKLAKSLGFSVIIIDHHEVLEKLPEADIIVDLKQEGEEYPFKDFSAGGLTFKLVEVLLADKMSEGLRRNFLELAALSTIADMVPQQSENLILIQEGLSFLVDSWRPGIRAFLEVEALAEYPNLRDKVTQIISILNVRDVQNNLPASFRLLTSASLEEAKELITQLLEKNKERKRKIGQMESEIEKRLLGRKEAIIFEGGEDFDTTLISTVASILCREHNKATFLYKKMAQESQGTVRTPKEVNGVNLMKQCSQYLLTYGGHPQAAGFRLKNTNLEKFKKCLIKNIK